MEHLVITGDFNLHLDCTTNNDTMRFMELLDSFSLQQHVNVPTHVHGHTLDLIITRQSDEIVKTQPWTDCLFSDHLPVFCELQISRPSLVRSKISSRKIKSINMADLRNDISRSELCTKYHAMCMNELVSCYDSTLSRLLDSHAPLITKSVVKRPIVPWFTNEIKDAKRLRRRAERKWRRSKSQADFLAYKSEKNRVTYIINSARRQYYTDFISENSSNQKTLFKAINTLFGLKSDFTFPDDRNADVLANDIGNYFVQKIERIRSDLDASTQMNMTVPVSGTPLTLPEWNSFDKMTNDDIHKLITNSRKKTSSLDPMPTPIVVESLDILLPVLTRMVNLSLEKGKFPDKWKIAEVRPVLKKPKMEPAFTNLRPISNLAFTSKLTERAVFNQTHNHLVRRIYILNSNLRIELTIAQKRLYFVWKNDILLSMNDQRLTLPVLLDLSAAFDTVDHGILLEWLHLQFGLSGQVRDWFASYLENRRQSVSINGGSSQQFQLKFGLPQGSCLGPLLFVLYSSELFNIIKSHLPNVHAFADDTQLYISFKLDDIDPAITGMTNCIADIKNWMLKDKLRLNDNKTEIVLIGTKQQLSKVSMNTFSFGHTDISLSSEVRNLGCWFDSNLTMDSQMTKTCKAAFYHIYNIRRIRKYLNSDTTQTLVNALVTSRLDYCNS